MTHFNYICGLCGCNKPYCAKIKLSENVDVAKGELLYYDTETFTVTPKKGTLTTIAGVCAETYKAEKSDLVPTYGCGYVSVILSEDALYSVEPYIFTTTETDPAVVHIHTNLPASSTKDPTGFIGAKIVLIEKAENSAHTGSLGSEYVIKEMGYDNGFITFATDYDGAVTKGDKYVLVPPYDFKRFILDEKKNLSVNIEGTGDFTVVAANASGYTLMLKS